MRAELADMGKVFVTKSFLPPIDEYKAYIDRIWDNGQLTNNGPLLREFESKVMKHLDVDNFHIVANGTLALQLALRSLDITEGEIITTPFSYVATTSAILWERCDPVYVDIEPQTLNIDPTKIEVAITDKTKAILAVHVFGNPCDIEAIDKIAKKHKLKVIYDAAHAFGVKYKGRSVFSYGDISVCSFHATKLFHTIEGGCIVTSSDTVSKSVDLLKRFGHNGDEHHQLGINAKASEFQAAMGLCNLGYINDIISERKRLSEVYDNLLPKSVTVPRLGKSTVYNYSYYPVIFESEEKTLRTLNLLGEADIFPRRYFYPSLNNLDYLTKHDRCPVSEDIAKRIACLPLFTGMDNITIRKICETIAK